MCMTWSSPLCLSVCLCSMANGNLVALPRWDIWRWRLVLSILNEDGVIDDKRSVNTFLLLCANADTIYYRHLSIEILLHRMSGDSYDYFAKSGGFRIIAKWMRIALQLDKAGECALITLLKICTMLKDKFEGHVQAANMAGIPKLVRKVCNTKSECNETVLTALHEVAAEVKVCWARKWQEIKKLEGVPKCESVVAGVTTGSSSATDELTASDSLARMDNDQDTHERPVSTSNDIVAEAVIAEETSQSPHSSSPSPSPSCAAPGAPPVQPVPEDLALDDRMQQEVNAVVEEEDKEKDMGFDKEKDGFLQLRVSSGRSDNTRPRPVLTSLVGGTAAISELLSLNQTQSPRGATVVPKSLSTDDVSARQKRPHSEISHLTVASTPSLRARSSKMMVRPPLLRMPSDQTAATTSPQSLFGIDEGTGLPLRPLPPPNAAPARGILKASDLFVSSAFVETVDKSTTKRLRWLDKEGGWLRSVVEFEVEQGHVIRQSTRMYKEEKAIHKNTSSAPVEDDTSASDGATLAEVMTEQSALESPQPSTSDATENFLPNVFVDTMDRPEAVRDGTTSSSSSSLGALQTPRGSSRHSTDKVKQDSSRGLSPQAKADLQVERVVALLQERGPMISSIVPLLYSEKYSERLDLVDAQDKKCKLIDFMTSIPHVHCSDRDTHPVYSYAPPASTPSVKIPCKYFNTRGGCIHGSDCRYLHYSPSESRSSHSVSAGQSNLSALREEVVNVIKAAGARGIVAAQLPRMYSDVYKKKLDIVDYAGGRRQSLTDFVMTSPQITQMSRKGNNPVFVHVSFFSRTTDDGDDDSSDSDEATPVSKRSRA